MPWGLSADTQALAHTGFPVIFLFSLSFRWGSFGNSTKGEEMFRLGLLLGFCTGFLVGINCPKLARQVSEILRRSAERLDQAAFEQERLQAGVG